MPIFPTWIGKRSSTFFSTAPHSQNWGLHSLKNVASLCLCTHLLLLYDCYTDKLIRKVTTTLETQSMWKPTDFLLLVQLCGWIWYRIWYQNRFTVDDIWIEFIIEVDETIQSKNRFDIITRLSSRILDRIRPRHWVKRVTNFRIDNYFMGIGRRWPRLALLPKSKSMQNSYICLKNVVPI